MTPKTHRKLAWELAQRQHDAIARRQLIELGFSTDAIRHRRATGRLHHTPFRGVYAVGRPELTREGHWMAAVLAGGPLAYLSHLAAGGHWRMLPRFGRNSAPLTPVDISLQADVVRHKAGLRIHRRPSLADSEVTTHLGIPITTPTQTLIDLATVLGEERLEAAVNEACIDLTDPDSLRAELERRKGQRGVPALRALLDRHTFRLTRPSSSAASLASSAAPGCRSPRPRDSSPAASTSTGTI